MRYFTIRKELQDANPYDILPKRKSFTIGELENSGFNKTQLHPVGIIHIKWKPEREGEREYLLEKIFQTNPTILKEFRSKFN